MTPDEKDAAVKRVTELLCHAIVGQRQEVAIGALLGTAAFILHALPLEDRVGHIVTFLDTIDRMAEELFPPQPQPQEHK